MKIHTHHFNGAFTLRPSRLVFQQASPDRATVTDEEAQRTTEEIGKLFEKSVPGLEIASRETVRGGGHPLDTVADVMPQAPNPKEVGGKRVMENEYDLKAFSQEIMAANGDISALQKVVDGWDLKMEPGAKVTDVTQDESGKVTINYTLRDPRSMTAVILAHKTINTQI